VLVRAVLCLRQSEKKGSFYTREIKTTHHRHTDIIIKNVCFFSRASGRFATQEGTLFRRRFVRFWSSASFRQHNDRRGCPVDGIFLLSCLLFAFRDCLSSSSSVVVVGAGSREIISFLVFEILSVCRRRAFDDATRDTLFGRRLYCSRKNTRRASHPRSF